MNTSTNNEKIDKSINIWNKTWPPLLVFTIFLAIWQVVVYCFQITIQILPSPYRILIAGWQDLPQLAFATGITVAEGLTGLVLAIFFGVLIAAGLYLSPKLTLAVQPLLVVSQTIPLIAVAPLLLIWFGFGPSAKVLLVLIYAIFPIIISTLQGLRETPQELIDVAKTWQCSKWWILIHISGKHALSQFFAGLRISATYTFGSAALAEFVGAKYGLGIYILSAQSSFRTDLVFVGAFSLALATLVLFGTVILLEKFFLRHTVSKNYEGGYLR